MDAANRGENFEEGDGGETFEVGDTSDGGGAVEDSVVEAAFLEESSGRLSEESGLSFCMSGFSCVESNGASEVDADKVEKTDVFGFTERNGEKFEVELQLSLRAYILFKEANSSLEKYITKIENSNLYLLKVNVNNPKPIISLIRGFKDELEIKGSKAFLEYLKVEKSSKI